MDLSQNITPPRAPCGANKTSSALFVAFVLLLCEKCEYRELGELLLVAMLALWSWAE